MDGSIRYRQAEEQETACRQKPGSERKGRDIDRLGKGGGRKAMCMNLARDLNQWVRVSQFRYIHRGLNLDLEVSVCKPLAGDQETMTFWKTRTECPLR